MKLFILECTEDELRANRGIMDGLVDACRLTINTFCGTKTSCATRQKDDPQESEDNA